VNTCEHCGQEITNNSPSLTGKFKKRKGLSIDCGSLMAIAKDGTLAPAEPSDATQPLYLAAERLHQEYVEITPSGLVFNCWEEE
jgi:hypothetical protein